MCLSRYGTSLYLSGGFGFVFEGRAPTTDKSQAVRVMCFRNKTVMLKRHYTVVGNILLIHGKQNKNKTKKQDITVIKGMYTCLQPLQ